MVSVQSYSPPRTGPLERGLTLLGTVVVTVGVSIVLGLLTAYAQGWLHGQSALLANTAGPWVLVAFALAALTRTPYGGMVSATVVLWLLELSYAVGAQARGYAYGVSSVSFWLEAGVLAGPVIGLAGHWVRRHPGPRAAAGAGILTGALVGEGLRILHDLGPGWYAWTQLALAAALFVPMARYRFPAGADLARSLAAAVPVALVVLAFLHRA